MSSLCLHSPSPLLPANILIVDDTPENLQVLSQTLSHQGYTVRGVVNGKMALRSARSALPDLILLDIKMPELNGYQVCEQLKSDPLTAPIPIIFISAIDDVLDKVKAFQAGGVDYITKPFQVEEVLARVQHQLTIRRLQQQLLTQNERLQQEIQERTKAELAAAAASQAKSQFLANMSHELRTPLNLILGFTQLLHRDPTLNLEQQESLRIINRSGEHLLELINDVLELSKIEAGEFPIHDTNFDLYRLLDNLEEMFQVRAEQKGLTLNFTVSPDVPQYIRTDTKKLRSCLINLLGNAIKFTQVGTVSLGVNVSAWESKLEAETPVTYYDLTFRVEDTGPGIDSQDIQHLFQAFKQTETGRQYSEGTGLGLTITRRFVQLMGGEEVKVNSILGVGSHFSFTIPVILVDASATLVKPRQQVVRLLPGQPLYRVLVVDDTPENRQLLVKLLSPLGFEVQEAENGKVAIALWDAWRPHLILMDTRMPILNGIEATQIIRTQEQEITDPLYHPTVIIAFTASIFEEQREELLATGCNDFIRKPFHEDTLFQKIQDYLGLQYQYQEEKINLYCLEEKQRFMLPPDHFFQQELASLPQPWIEDLYQAVNRVDEEAIAKLIQQIPTAPSEGIKHDYIPLIQSLTHLLKDYRLDILLRLLQLPELRKN